ncbi:hypothetical protein ACOCEA_04465 [Maribacter sp. CXY002]|uniref:hypothetical protein n=1 Tax=Maribacter luteocoastalis TaxID=3407671 RepID=UPI003B684896
MKIEKQTNIFIAHTPLQNFIATEIVKQFFMEDNFENRLYTSVFVEGDSLFEERYFINKKGGFKKIFQFAKIKRQINRLLKEGNGNIFIPHTAALLDNYYFYDFPLERYNVKINFYYEGILYFYHYLEPYKTHTHLVRKTIGFLSGFNYRIEPEILPVNNDKVNKIFTILKKFTLGPKEKLNEISLLQEGYTPQPGNILILGGKPTLLNNEEVISLYNEMIEFILNLELKTQIFFKGHHADVSNNFEKANIGRINIIDITRNSPVEEVIEDFSPSIILSYPSSGLVNLKAMYGENIEVNSYYIRQKNEHLSKLWPIFDELQIKKILI